MVLPVLPRGTADTRKEWKFDSSRRRKRGLMLSLLKKKQRSAVTCRLGTHPASKPIPVARKALTTDNIVKNDQNRTRHTPAYQYFAPRPIPPYTLTIGVAGRIWAMSRGIDSHHRRQQACFKQSLNFPISELNPTVPRAQKLELRVGDTSTRSRGEGGDGDHEVFFRVGICFPLYQ